MLRNYAAVQEEELSRLRGDLTAYRMEAQTAMRVKVAYPRDRVNVGGGVAAIERDIDAAAPLPPFIPIRPPADPPRGRNYLKAIPQVRAEIKKLGYKLPTGTPVKEAREFLIRVTGDDNIIYR